ncbi:MAG: hypothetical protein WB729_11250 [Candidatus Sulfotelmatobacter sp.]
MDDMPNLMSSSHTCEVKMPHALTIGALEEVLFEDFRTSGPDPASLLLDLSACQFIELVALLHLVALTADRTRRGFTTQFALPKSKDVRDFMRVWEFPNAIRDATGVPLSKLVMKEDLAYFGENSEFAALRYAQFYGYEGGLQRMLSTKFFAITSFLTALPSQPRFALSESSRWQETLVRSVLTRYLRGPDNYVASRIVFEAATNAVRHPGAGIIQTASTFFIPRRAVTVRGILSSLALRDGILTVETAEGTVQLLCSERTTFFHQMLVSGTRARRKRMSGEELVAGQMVAVRTGVKSQTNALSAIEVTLLADEAASSESVSTTEQESTSDAGYLTIVFWDDGQSIVDTLKEAIVSGKSIRSIEVPDLYADFEMLQCDHKGGIRSRTVVNSSYVPDATTPEDLLLLAATFPGITRDVSGSGRDRVTTPPTNPVLDSPGMGLYVLLNTVIDVFGGSVFFRTKRLGMSVKKAALSPDGTSVKYVARIREFGHHTPRLLGNMVVVRLPVREQES